MLHITSLLRKAILYNLAYRPDIAILKTINTPSWAVYERLINEMEIKIKVSIAIGQIQTTQYFLNAFQIPFIEI